MIKNNSQANSLYEHFKSGKTINRLQALTELGIFELSARVCDLEKRGVVINKRTISITNRFDERVRLVEYSLGKPA